MSRMKMTFSKIIKKCMINHKIYRVGEMVKKRKSISILLICVGGFFMIVVLHNISGLKDAERAYLKYPSAVKINGRTLNINNNKQKPPKIAYPSRVSFIPGMSNSDKNFRSHSTSSRISHVTDNKVFQNSSSLLVLSSVGRSGSSFLGELVAAQEHNFYIYEPIRALKRGTLRQDLVQEELIKNFRCQISPSFLSVEKDAFISIKHPYTYGKSRQSLTLDGLKNACESEPMKIIKTIRTRLEWTKKLLDEKDLNLKVLHLVRDPRGSFKSMDSLNWKISIKEMCHRLTNDLRLKNDMEKLYPDRYFFIKYEDLCRTPYIKTREIFKFLNGINSTTTKGEYDDNPVDPIPALSLEPPKSVFNYLKSHIYITRLSNESPWSTNKNPFSHYQKWRHYITQNELSQIEEECLEALSLLGYRAFGTLDNVKNMSVPLFIGERTFKIMYSSQNDSEPLYN